MFESDTATNAVNTVLSLLDPKKEMSRDGKLQFIVVLSDIVAFRCAWKSLLDMDSLVRRPKNAPSSTPRASTKERDEGEWKRKKEHQQSTVVIHDNLRPHVK